MDLGACKDVWFSGAQIFKLGAQIFKLGAQIINLGIIVQIATIVS